MPGQTPTPPPHQFPRLTKAQQHVDQHRYQEARSLLPESPTPWTPLVLVESYLHQGKVGEAEATIKRLGAELPAENVGARAIRLYGHLLLVHHGQLSEAKRHLERARENLEAKDDTFLRVFTQDIHNRAEIMAITMGLSSPLRVSEVSKKTERVAETYAEIGELRRAKNARIRAADLWLREVGGDYATGTKLLEAIIKESRAEGLVLAAGWAQLRLAEARMTHRWQAGDETWQEEIAAFESAASLLEAGGLAEHEAVVEARYGELLLRLGIAEGKTLVEKAAERLPTENYLPLLDGAWGSYEVYCKRSGDLAGGKRAAAARKATAALIDTPMLHAIGELAAADQAFREGRIAEARRQLERLVTERDVYYVMASISILATVIGSINDRETALALLETFAERMRAVPPTPFLSQLYYVMMGQVMDQPPARALEYIDLALAVDREIGDRRSEGQHLGVRAWLLARANHLAGAETVVTEAIEEEFTQAVGLLEAFRDQEGREMLASTCQHRAQAYLFGKRHDQAWQWYDLAREVAEASN